MVVNNPGKSSKNYKETYLKSFKWYLVERIPNSPLWFTWSPLVAYMKELHNLYGLPKFHWFYIFEKGVFSMYNIEGEFEDAGKRLLDNEKRKKGTIIKILEEIEDLSKKLFDISKEIQHLDLKNISDKKLVVFLKKAFKIHDDVWIRGQAINCLEHGHSLLGDTLRKSLNADRVPKGEIESTLVFLTTPEKYSNLQKEEQELINLAGKSDKSLDDHWEKYAWLGYNWGGPAYDRQYFLDRLEALKNDNKVVELELSEREYIREVLQKKKSVFDKFKISSESKYLSKLIEQIIYLKAFRVDASWAFYWALEPIFEKLARKFNISFKEVQFLFPYEMIDGLGGKPIEKNLGKERKELSAFLIKDGKFEEYRLEDAKIYADFFKKLESVSLGEVQELKGSCGSPGFAKGNVKLVETSKDMEKMNDGDVLVSHMTNPSLVPAMKKASAIVADIGGITSHAAIVARELKKPCIIGTKIATKVLKDGDFVEVYADEGIVKILRK